MLKLLKSTKVQLLIIVLLTFLAYSNIFQNEFVIDDRGFIVDWEEKKSLTNIGEFFKGAVPPGHEGVYRPLRSVLYAIYYQIWGTNIFGYHLHSILVHLGSTILVYFIVRELMLFVRGPASRHPRPMSSLEAITAGTRRGTPAPVTPHKLTSPLTSSSLSLRAEGLPPSPFTLYPLPFIASLLFGLHPIHTETITYISSSMDAFGMMLMFLSFYLYLLAQFTSKVKKMGLHLRGVILAGSVVSAFAAYFTNETTLVLPLLLILYESLFRGKGKALRVKGLVVLYPYFLIAGLYLLIRFLVLDITTRGPYLAGSVYLTILTMTKVFIKYLSLLFWPFNQANNHTIRGGIEAFVYRGYNQDVIKAQSLLSIDILVSTLILIVICIIAWKARKKFPLVTFGIFWFFISLLPVSEIIPQGSILGERFLYIPSFGFMLVMSHLGGVIAFSSPPRWFKLKSFKFYAVVLTFTLLLLSFYFYQTYQRNKDWHDEITFWKADIVVYPKTNAYAYFQLGNAYSAEGSYGLGIENYEKSSGVNPNFAIAIATKALLLEKLGDQDQAVLNYQKAIVSDPKFWEGYFRLGAILIQQGRNDEARDIYKKLLLIYPQLEDEVKNILNNI